MLQSHHLVIFASTGFHALLVAIHTWSPGEYQNFCKERNMHRNLNPAESNLISLSVNVLPMTFEVKICYATTKII